MRALVVVSLCALASAARAQPAPAQPAPAQPVPAPTSVDARDPLDEARELEATLDYERALVIVDREIAKGTAQTGRLIELHLLAGRLAAGIDRADVARAHFARVLELAPDTRLPDGTSPKLTAPFDAARAQSTPLRVAIRRVGDVVTVDASGDAAHLVSGVRLHAPDKPDIVSGNRTSMRIPPDRIATAADAIDEYGNVVASAVLPVDIAPVRAEPRTPIAARWTTWAIATGGALVIAGTCAWRFESAQDQWNQLERAGGHDYSELAAIQSRGRDWAIAADVGFGVAAAAGIAAIAVLALHREPPAAVSAGGIAIAF